MMKKINKNYIILTVLYILLFVSAYNNISSGYIADEKNLDGCSVAIFGCYVLPVTFLIFISTLIYQIVLITKRNHKTKENVEQNKTTI